ncbi:MAG: RNase adapter RapZ [Blastocatellia bacterium]|nr:RNase adapter RapZ [Chloracidobacterium sp.]MBL8184654.1 RNase adapter RapZ [Blastocatellia bacterium]HBE83758.1 RNase adapter RapZ [Blastocatellia bacterium]HRJ87563.1 RNase adapter RapZ [Pyrinomonadaceae bacterium]HRK50520.1 RNase adapter RapZ [Pyrinomonadaceae bacterium]
MSSSQIAHPSDSRLVIITGLSGSGMSSATNAFEDLGYFCVDNLPITLLSTFARLLSPSVEDIAAINKAALVINIRERQFLAEFPSEVKKLAKRDIEPFVVFFEASDDVLRRRFSETRRPHPADSGKGLLAAIKSEKKAMKVIRSMADLIIDTSDHTVHTLRRSIIQRFSHAGEAGPLKVQILSFGHKYGNPHDVDILFDVRHLPNPFFDLKLRDKTGEDPAIVRYLKKSDDVRETIDRFADLLEYLLPFYRHEGKSYLTIGVGCTGGKHRSVMVANELRKRLKKSGYELSVVHRDMQK